MTNLHSRFVTRKRLALIALIFTAAPASAATLGPACGKGDSNLPGHYTMSGVMEVGSELLIRRDGSFAFYLAYGANDQLGGGCWTQTGDTVALIPEGKRTVAPGHTPETRGFKGILLKKQGSKLLWRIPGSRHTGVYSK